MADTPDKEKRPFLRTRAGLALLVFGGVAAFFFIAEHRAHAFGVLPYLILLACPLMHIFMHRGHGGHGDHAGHSPAPPQPADRQPTSPGRAGEPGGGSDPRG